MTRHTEFIITPPPGKDTPAAEKHRRATALAAEVWSMLEDSQTEESRRVACQKMREAILVMEETPPPPRRNPADPRPVETDRDEWFPSIRLGARAAELTDQSVRNVLYGIQKTAAGRVWKYSEHKTAEAFAGRLQVSA